MEFKKKLSYIFVFCTFTLLGFFQQYLSSLEKKEKIKQNLEQYLDIVSDIVSNELKNQILLNGCSESDRCVVLYQDGYFNICNQNHCQRYDIYRLRNNLNKILPRNLSFSIKLNEYRFFNEDIQEQFQIEHSFVVEGIFKIQINLRFRDLKNTKLMIAEKFSWSLYGLGFLLISFVLKYQTQLAEKHFRRLRKIDLTTNAEQISNIKDKHLRNLKKFKVIAKNILREYKFGFWTSQECHKTDIKITNMFIEELKDILTSNGNFLDYNLYDISRAETVDLKILMQDIKLRFQSLHTALKINFEIKTDVLEFCSKAALYQIFYSIVGNWILITSSNTSINISIEEKEEYTVYILITFDSTLKSLERENSVKEFNSNFMLDIDAIIQTLTNSGFECKIFKNSLFHIEIKKKLEVNEGRNNMIDFNTKKNQ